MEHFQNQIKEELSKLDKRFVNLKDNAMLANQPAPRETIDHQTFLKIELGCDVCPEYFPSPAQLILHQKTHTGQIPSICNFCLKSFALKENHAGHKCQRMPSEADLARLKSQLRRCEKCDKVTSSCVKHECSGQAAGLYHAANTFTCKVCRKSYTDEKHLKMHMRSHSGLKPFNCQFCNKSFAYQHVLKLHQVQHYSSRVYQCTLCQTTFPSKKDMETHIMTHDDCDDVVRPHPYQRLPPARPSSTGSASASSCTDSSSSPAGFRRYPGGAAGSISRRSVLDMCASEIAKCSPAELMLPSINSIYSDDDVKSLPKIIRPSSKVSVVRQNPIFPITDDLMARLMREDKENFGHLQAVKVPSLSELLAGASKRQTKRQQPMDVVESQEEPMDLSNSIDNHDDAADNVQASPCEVEVDAAKPSSTELKISAPLNSTKSTFLNMDKTSLPPIKRRLAYMDANRGSVIQFALKNEN